MFYHIYGLLSLKDDKFYTGYTENLKLRFEEHKNGYISSIKDRRPLKLIYSEACLDDKDAINREVFKDLSRKDVY